MANLLKHSRPLLAWSVAVLGQAFLSVGCGSESPADRGKTGILTAALEPNSTRDALNLPNGVKFGPDFEQNPRVYQGDSFNQTTPKAVAFDGTNYLVVWQALGPSSGVQKVQAARVTPQMAVLDREPIEIDAEVAQQTGATVASDGSGFLVGYRSCPILSRPGSNCEVRVKRISSEGTVLDKTAFRLAPAERTSGGLVLSSNGQGYLATWTEQATATGAQSSFIQAALVSDQDSSPVGPSFNIAETTANAVLGNVLLTNAASKTNYLVAWSEPHGDTEEAGVDLVVTRVTPEGKVLASTTSPGADRLWVSSQSVAGLVAASDGQDFLLAWSSSPSTAGVASRKNRQLFGSRISGEGIFLDTSPLILGGGNVLVDGPQVASIGSGYLLGWTEYSSTATDPTWQARGSFVGSDRAGDPPVGLSLYDGEPASALVLPSHCPEGACFLSLVADLPGSPRAVIGGLYDPRNGPLQATQCVEVSLAPRSEFWLDAACSKQSCLALWMESQFIDGAWHRALQSGMLEPGGRLRANSTRQIALATQSDNYIVGVASDGDSFLVVRWEDLASNGSKIWAEQFDASGRPGPLGAVLVAELPGWPTQVNVEFTGEEYLVVYPTATSNENLLIGATVNRDGALQNPRAFAMTRPYYKRLWAGQLVASPSQSLLVFAESSFINGEPDTWSVARLDPQGGLIEGSTRALLTSDGKATIPSSAASNGRDFLISWIPTPPSGSPTVRDIHPRASILSQEGKLTPLVEPLSPAGSVGALAWDGNAYLWSWSVQASDSTSVTGQHFTELVPEAEGRVRTRDSFVANSWPANPVTLTPSSAGILWTYSSPAGHPELQLGSSWRIHRTLVTGLCFGDPLGDQNGDGICDSLEPPALPIVGSGGASSGVGGASGSLGGEASGGESQAPGGAGGQGGASDARSSGAGGSLFTTENNVGGGLMQAGGAASGTGSAGSLGGGSQAQGTGGASGEGTSNQGTNLDDPGCGCRMAETRATPSWTWVGLLAAVLGRRKRRVPAQE